MRDANWDEIFQGQHTDDSAQPDERRVPAPWGDWLTFLLTAVAFMSVAASVDSARWVKGLPSLYPIGFSALIIGYGLSRIRWNQLLLYPLGLFLGALALLLLREQPSIGCYPERLTGFWLTFWIGVAGSALAGLGFTASGARGWSVSRRRFVAAVGAASFAWGFEVHNRVLSDRTSLRGGRLQVVAVGNERTTTSWESVSPSAFQMPCAQLTERRACGALSSINALVWPVTA